MGQGYTQREGKPKPPPPPPGPPIWSTRETWNEAAIPPRPWLAPGYFLRGAVTTVVGPGGVSKSSLVIAWAVALALGRACNGMTPKARYRSVIFNVEDDQHEQHRRLSGALTNQGKVPADVAEYIARSGPFKTGMLFDRDPETGDVQPTPALDMLERDLLAEGADILFVDPLAELHSAEENDNVGMRSIVAEFRAIAVRLNMAVVIVHHTRKGAVTPGDVDASRGASAISGASRVMLTITSMTAEECKIFGLPQGSERHYLRVDGGKSNYASLATCEWFERLVYDLANGDTVAVTVPWKPPEDTVTLDVQAKVQAAIKAGAGSLGPLAPTLSDTPRSVRLAMEAAGIKTRPGQQKMLMLLLKAGNVIAEFKDNRRKWVNGLRTADGYPDAEWKDASGPDSGVEGVVEA